MSGVIALIPRHVASLRICRPVNVAATPSMALNFLPSFVALAGRAVLTAVTASPTAAERVPRAPCTTTRNVAAGCAAAASSRLWGTTGLLLPTPAIVAAVPADRTGTISVSAIVPASAVAHGSSRRLGRCSIRTAVRPDAKRDATFLSTVHISVLRRRRITSGIDQKSRSGSRRSAAQMTRYGSVGGASSPFWGTGGVSAIPPRV